MRDCINIPYRNATYMLPSSPNLHSYLYMYGRGLARCRGATFSSFPRPWPRAVAPPLGQERLALPTQAS